MGSPCSLDLLLLPGARALLAIHARELPQRDDLCGAFCGSLALRAAGVGGDDTLDQDAVALASGSVVSAVPDSSALPFGEPGRRDYRLRLPLVEEASTSGTTAEGLIGAIAELSGERILALPYTGPWSAATLAGLFELIAALARPASLVANIATHHLWGSRARADQLLAYLLEGNLDGPAPDWDVGHFVCILARLRGPSGSLYLLADTYPSLGDRGVHLQPQERLAAAIERRDMPAGGVLALVAAQDAPAVRAGAGALGLIEGAWENGSVAHRAPAGAVSGNANARDTPA
jgi:hypothetical protein